MKEEDIEIMEPQMNIWLPDKEGDQVEGSIIKIVEGQFGSQYILKQANGEEITMPSHKYLLPRLAMCKIGDTVRVRYDGKEPPKLKGQNSMRTYTVGRVTRK